VTQQYARRRVVYNPRMANNILTTIGNTPVVRLRNVAPADAADIYLKLEFLNPTGSYKDRMALAMIERAEQRGALRPGMKVVEYTGGSTGSSLAMVCAVKGYPFTAVTSDGFAEEKLRTMRAFGAELRVIESDGGKLTPALFRQMIEEAERLACEPGTYYTDQFNNPDAIQGYMPIGRELATQLGTTVDVFCGGVGTGGMIRGTAQALREAGCQARIVALEPASSPTLTTGRGGAHRVEGLAPGFLPPHMQGWNYEARAVEESEARAMARTLAEREGILAGTSTGLNVVAALQLARELGFGHCVATVAVDTGLKYFAGDLFRDQRTVPATPVTSSRDSA
jgi:cysteine synthase